MDKQDAGIVYIPYEHQIFAAKVYDSLGVKYCIGQGDDESISVLPPQSLISFWQNELQECLEINVYMVGEDLVDRIDGLHNKYPLKGTQTSNVFLNCSNKEAVWAYHVLEEAGYFFTGLKPLYGKKEYMVMHNPGEVEIYFEDYVVSSEFAKVLNYVRKAYENRRRLE